MNAHQRAVFESPKVLADRVRDAEAKVGPLGDENASLRATVETLKAQVASLEASGHADQVAMQSIADSRDQFKAYVHERLDAAGIPFDPEPDQNALHGCRVEGRLNSLIRERDDAIKRFESTDTPDLKSARKRLQKKSEEVLEANKVKDAMMLHAQRMVANAIVGVRQLCVLAANPGRSVQEADQMLNLATSMMKVPVQALLNGQVRLVPAPTPVQENKP